MRFNAVPVLVAVLVAAPLPAEQQPTPWPILEPAQGDPLPATRPLTWEGDLSQRLVLANDAFLDRQIALAQQARAAEWAAGFDREAHRERLAELLGLDRDARAMAAVIEYFGSRHGPLATAGALTVSRVRWDVIEGVRGEGLLLEPAGEPIADVVAIPDADESPEAIAGLLEPGSAVSPYAAALAQSGCRVLVPTLVDRGETQFGMTRREWLHRPAFELGRTLLGYEQHTILAGAGGLAATGRGRPLGVIGWGEGGLHALYAAAVDPSIDACCVSGSFGPRESLWKEPAEHTLFGLLSTFSDAEIAAMIAPRPLVIEFGCSPDAGFRTVDGEPEIREVRPQHNGKPGRFEQQTPAAVQREAARLRKLVGDAATISLHETASAIGPEALTTFLKELAGVSWDGNPDAPQWIVIDTKENLTAAVTTRRQRFAAAIERHGQRCLVRSPGDRATFFAGLNTASLAKFNESVEGYREYFRTAVIGDFELPLAAANPRSRPFQVGEKTISYEVVLDVFAEEHGGPVFAYGILTVPKSLDLSGTEQRPVVVCQHGLEGTPQDVVGQQKFGAYQAFATRLAERGYITFAPQNGYKYFDRFRLQQFKAQSLGKTLFSIIVPQHEQITAWLAGLPFVDGERIGFYGLSYGGKSAMRIPPLVDRYCLSICSGDFNDWVWKNAATDKRSLRYSYANKGEYEIFEWNLGGTFSYAEMASLICPRPFFVERGHFDGVAPDEAVAAEFAKVRRLYQAKLGIGERCDIEWFVGPHAIHGVGSYQFLDRHLDWKPAD